MRNVAHRTVKRTMPVYDAAGRITGYCARVIDLTNGPDGEHAYKLLLAHCAGPASPAVPVVFQVLDIPQRYVMLVGCPDCSAFPRPVQKPPGMDRAVVLEHDPTCPVMKTQLRRDADSGAFSGWLARHGGWPGPLGDLAGQVKNDPCWPPRGGLVDYEMYLLRAGAGPDAVEGLRWAWERWQQESAR